MQLDKERIRLCEKVEVFIQKSRVFYIVFEYPSRVQWRKVMETSKEVDLFGLADELTTLREQKETLAEASKENGEEIERVQSELIKKMMEVEVSNFNRRGNKFTLAVSSHFSQVAEKKEELFEALRDNNCGDIIVEKIDPRTLSKTVNELCEENEDSLPQWLAGLVNGFEKPIIRVSKQK
jgi:hypothetical protein